MKVLVVTSCNPINNSLYYNYLLDKIKEENIEILSFPFFAETYARVYDKLYIPSLLSMIETSVKDKELHNKLYKEDNTIIVGTTHKKEKFDMIISLGKKEEESNYIGFLKDNEAIKGTKLQKIARQLYDWDDAEHNFPTVEHVELFLRGVFELDG